MQWKEYFEYFCSKTDDELVEIGSGAVRFLVDVLSDNLNIDDDEEKMVNAIDVVFQIISTFVNADEEVDESEYEFVLKILDTTKEELPFENFKEYIGEKNEDLENVLDVLIDTISAEFCEDFKKAVCDLGTCIAAFDGAITKPEILLIAKYYNE